MIAQGKKDAEESNEAIAKLKSENELKERELVELKRKALDREEKEAREARDLQDMKEELKQAYLKIRE